MSRWVPAYHTACQIQKKVLEAMGLEIQHANRVPKPSAKKVELTPGQLKQLADTWANLEERKRILRMRPTPKPIDVTPKPKARPAAIFKE